MTDRINFAVVGGIVTSEPSTTSSSSSDFGAQGFLDNLTNLPAVPTFLSIIHVMQNVCFYTGFLDILATNPHPASCPTNPLGAISNVIPGLGPALGLLIPGLGGMLGGGGAEGGGAKKDGGIGDILGGIFGGGAGGPNIGGGSGGGNGGGGDKKNGGGGGLGIIGDIIGGIFGGGNKPPTPAPSPIPEPMPEPMPEPVAPPPPAPPTTSPGLRGGKLPGIPMPSPKPRDKLFGLFSDDDTQDSQETSESDMRKIEQSRGADRLVSHDGRVAKIVRMKKRGQAQKEADMNDSGDFV
ncbi:hypothetical protein BGZ82_001614 [Podila clonocystis]|nr:hypothetical protein BGZ82_001614 [Podila clonocystis]